MWLGELLRHFPGLVLFAGLLAVALWAVAQPAGPWWFRVAARAFSLFLIIWTLRGFAHAVRHRFGVRIVPRFERRLAGEPTACFSGEMVQGVIELA